MSFLNYDMSLTSDDPSDLFSPCSDNSQAAADNTALRTTANNVDLNGRQFNPVMKGPRIMDVRKASGALQHQRSAKALITRYESMTNTERPRAIPRPSRTAIGWSSQPPGKITYPLSVHKDKSPLRQSFRNLFSVFRKGNSVIKDVIKDKTIGSTEISSVFGGGNPVPLPGLTLQPTSDSFVVLPRDTPQPPSKPCAGSLLYLSRVSTTPSTLPVWTTCTATLQIDHILITWLTTQGNPHYHVISLAHCEDVRSVVLSQISADERALLPCKGDSHDLKIFEILFKDRPMEKFAATSAHERAGWVCAIWDAILPSHEQKDVGSDEMVTTEGAGLTIETSFSTNSQTERAVDVVRVQTKPSPYRFERSLPPTPTETMPPPLPAEGTPLHDLPHRLGSPNTPFHSRPVSRASATSSPSVANLGQLSVVKQRLAQIERFNSSSSSSSPCSSRRSNDMLATSKVGLSRWEPSELQSQTSLRSNDGDSIFDSYGEMTSPYVERSVLLSTQTSCPQKRANPPTRPECESPKACWDNENPAGLFSPLSQYSVTDEPANVPLAGILQNDIRHDDQVANVGNQILSLQQVVQKLPEQIKAIVFDPKQAPLLAAIDQTVRSMDQQGKERKTELRDVREILHGISEIIRGRVPLGSHGLQPTTANDSRLLQSLEEVHLKLESNLPEVLRKLGEIQAVQTLAGHTAGDESPTVVFNNVKPSSQECKIHGDAKAVDMSEVHTKLDGLLALCEGRLASLGSRNCDETVSKSLTQVPEELKEILTLLRGNENHCIIQERQQAEGVRYLNELNSWLEMFVNNGTSQIQAVANGVQQLCNTLGCTQKSMDTLGVDADGTGIILADIRQLLLANKERDENATTLQASVNSLVAVINRQNANIFTPESVVDLINRQRHDQEGLFRALATELSDEIRGERLKFVEAMKSATSINVQFHVDQFKKELTREVLAMTQEVERLQRERHGVENQIADLLAFYSKQKQTGVPWTLPSPSGPSQNDSFRAPSFRGPLPNPNSHCSRGR